MDFKPETLTGDVRDFLLGHLRQMPKPWAQMNETEQGNVIAAATSAAGLLVERATHVIAAHEFPQVGVYVNKFSVKDGELKAEIQAIATEKNLLNIAGAKRAVIVIADPDVFFGEQQAAKPEPDQRALELGREYTDEDGIDEEPDGLDGEFDEDAERKGDDDVRVAV